MHELARELGVTSRTVLTRLQEQGVSVRSASSTVDAGVARRLRDSFGHSEVALQAGASTARQSSWRAGAIRHRRRVSIWSNGSVILNVPFQSPTSTTDYFKRSDLQSYTRRLVE
ncbi:translation initiation factor IF-2 N-terminal domain-containing protein [Saccharomonospora sp. NPDC046836]|uniref:translation initiation factor IF-2 N-terminal domain-containing protein n=1 Tax=Saccharomonospora sp. NPDC046836 TaxID=3156921 RepID=UPI0033E101FF